MDATDDQKRAAWEKIRHLTLDQFVTQVKLTHGSAFMLDGYTTPEGWPWVFVLAIARPGNEAAVELAKKFHDEMIARAKWNASGQHPDVRSAVPK